MNTETILRLLKNSGFNVLGADAQFVYIEDPGCVLRGFETFINYAWIGIVCITGVLLFGWAISMIRGAKNNVFINLRNLTLMFGTLGAVVPLVNFIWGDDLFARGCDTVRVAIGDVNQILQTRNLKLARRNADDLFEEFDIYDSAAGAYSNSDLVSENLPQNVNVASVDVNSSSGADVSANVAPAPARALDGAPSSSDVTRPVSVRVAGNDVVYIDSNNREIRHTGGSRAWRNNNPGNIRYSEFTKRMGAIGSAGGFAVFPDEKTGANAIGELLKTKSYRTLTIAQAIHRYAPPFENNTAAYNRRIAQSTELDLNRRMDSLSDEELARVVNTIRAVEGWKPGRRIVDTNKKA